MTNGMSAYFKHKSKKAEHLKGKQSLSDYQKKNKQIKVDKDIERFILNI